MLRDFISLIYPNLCHSCGKPLYNNEKCICTMCRFQLPKTNFHREEENPVSQLFWGKSKVEAATSYYYFNKGASVQKLIHQLKYQGRKEVGHHIGTLFGQELKSSVAYKDADCIIPVPLHPKKQRKRGYNQSECIAEGLAESMGVELNTGVLKRTVANTTQTRKSLYNRWKNVEAIFKVENSESIKGKNILLVDDVVTTGSTLEACVDTLHKVPGVKVRVATLAFAAN